MRKWHNVEQNTEKWFTLRMGRFTGSEFRSLMAGKETAAYRTLIANKAYERITGQRVVTFVNEWMNRGHELEDDARMEYTGFTFNHVEPGGFFTLGDNMGASPDGLICDIGLLEIKCPALHTHVEYLRKNALPSEYKWQVHGQLMVSGMDYCDFISYYPGTKLFVYKVNPNANLIAELLAKIEDAEQDVQDTIKLII